MKYYLSCDWGTTTFRLRLASLSDSKVIAEEKSDAGIASVFDLWQQTNNLDATQRIAFYLSIIPPYIKAIEEKIKESLAGTKLIISGMASSSIGIMDIPYALAPAALDATGLSTRVIPASEAFNHDVLIISGVRVGDDVIRGEETQLAGYAAHGVPDNQLVIIPGTHSKHILLKQSKIVGIKTYMTGELFALLSQKSILKNSVAMSSADSDLTSFKKGVHDAMGENILHAVFKVRTNQLFNIYSKQDNYNYLSGLLIGAEIKDLKTTTAGVIDINCDNADMYKYYSLAIAEAGITTRVNTFNPQFNDTSAVRGQLRLARQLNFIA